MQPMERWNDGIGWKPEVKVVENVTLNMGGVVHELLKAILDHIQG